PPVNIATLLNSLLTLSMIRFLVPPNVHRCELRLARMKISIYAPYAKERFETARQHSILHPERIVGNPEVIHMSDKSSSVYRSGAPEERRAPASNPANT